MAARSQPISLLWPAGIRPETTLEESGAVEVGRSIVVDDKLETSQPGIYAIGECAEHRGQCYGMVEPVHEQARVLARHLAGDRACYAKSLIEKTATPDTLRLAAGNEPPRARAPKPSSWRTNALAATSSL
jgi:NAD(P)H-nitrite reductase large subunit